MHVVNREIDKMYPQGVPDRGVTSLTSKCTCSWVDIANSSCQGKMPCAGSTSRAGECSLAQSCSNRMQLQTSKLGTLANKREYQCCFNLHFFLIVHGSKCFSHAHSMHCSFMSSDHSLVRILLIFPLLLKICLHVKVVALYCWDTLGTFPPGGSWPFVFQLLSLWCLPSWCFACSIFHCFCLLLVLFSFCDRRCWLFHGIFLFAWTYKNFIFMKPNLDFILYNKLYFFYAFNVEGFRYVS